MRFDIKWQFDNGSDCDGLLYCAQRIEEMTMPYTSHFYKAPVYNSFMLIYEYLSVYNYVDKKLLDKSHLKNIMDEFIDSFSKDVVVKENFNDYQIKKFIQCLKSESIIVQRKTLEYLCQVMKNYLVWCEKSLKEVVKKPKEKKKIDKTLRAYVPMLIDLGYHPYCINKECKKIFGREKVCNIDAFFEMFNGEEKTYSVYFTVDKNVEKFQNILEERLGMRFEKDDFSEILHYDKDKKKCVHLSVTALDAKGAVKSAYSKFELFMRYYRFLGNRNRKWIGFKCLVKNENDKYDLLHIGAEQYFYSKNYDDRTLGENTERIITKLLENTGFNDIYNIDKLIQTHNNALAIQNANSAFLNLWPVLEIIGVDGCDNKNSNIRRILDNIIPILKRRYVRNVIKEMHDYLKGNLERNEYKWLMDNIEECGDENYKIACLIILDKYDRIRHDLYDVLKEYPLIRSRMSQLHEDVFKNKKKFIGELNRYGQRIEWHIQRLYRVRNAIIHSGDDDDKIISLIEHLHSYVDEVIFEIIERLTCSDSLGSISNVLFDAQLYIESIYKDSDKSANFSIDDIKIIIQ